MQDIYRELGLTTSSSTPLSDQDTQRAALSDLRSSVMAETRHISIFPQSYFDPGTVIQRATESSRLLSDVAVGTTVIVLQDVHSIECHGMQEFQIQYFHSARAGMRP
ncbi:hypothetical protein AAFF_G00337560 [Aldrovandia affinis]|uniref:Uncharacterized protein n=1 Tax=Aldrovandia affinis TaxID=143900 RepID=A0AAD7WQC4_9TELE|nr:hypothetical protein AAFF_G00337560 [Aldrovandia affinis]